MRTKTTSIYSRLLEATRHDGHSKLAFHGSISIEGENSDIVLKKELRRISDRILAAVSGCNPKLYWISHTVLGKENDRGDGSVYVGNAVSHFLMSHVLDQNGKPIKEFKDSLFYMINAFIEYELDDFQPYRHSGISFEKALCLDAVESNKIIHLSPHYLEYLYFERGLVPSVSVIQNRLQDIQSNPRPSPANHTK